MSKSIDGGEDVETLLNTHRAVLLNAMGAWVQESLKDPRRVERANRSVMSTLTQHLGPLDNHEIPDVPITDEQRIEAEVVSGFFAIFGMLSSLQECERYFRRYPFGNVNISRADYLRNCCEMTFDRIVQLKDRLKISLNAISKIIPS